MEITMMYKIVNKQVAIDPDKHLMKPQYNLDLSSVCQYYFQTTIILP